MGSSKQHVVAVSLQVPKQRCVLHTQHAGTQQGPSKHSHCITARFRCHRRRGYLAQHVGGLRGKGHDNTVQVLVKDDLAAQA